ncbi:MAG: DUF554 family protein [Christensenellales bacterium]
MRRASFKLHNRNEFQYLLTAVGGTLVMCVGINILEIKEIRTADLVPAIAFCLFVYLF